MLPLFLVAVEVRNLLHIGESPLDLGDGLQDTAEGLVVARLLDKAEEVILDAVLGMLVAGTDGFGDVSLLVCLLEAVDGDVQILNRRVDITVIFMIDVHNETHYPQVSENCKAQIKLSSNNYRVHRPVAVGLVGRA